LDRLFVVCEQGDTNHCDHTPQELGQSNIVIQEEKGQDGRDKGINGNDRGHMTRFMLVDHVEVEIVGRDVEEKNEEQHGGIEVGMLVHDLKVFG
jgi:hypothetical protein